jgi:hypothetical protein
MMARRQLESYLVLMAFGRRHPVAAESPHHINSSWYRSEKRGAALVVASVRSIVVIN